MKWFFLAGFPGRAYCPGEVRSIGESGRTGAETMKVFATRLIDITELKAPEIAEQWYTDVKKNPRTPFYHKLSEDEAIPQATDFYRHFRSLFMAEKPYEMAQQVFSRYAVDRFAEGVPLPEAIYALTLMRRHIWLYAEFQAIFTSTIERQVVVESLNRTILMFDYATHVITQKYQELMKEEYDGKLADLRAIGMKGSDNVGKGLLMAVFLITAGLITYYYQAVRESGVIFTHLFYIPIILGCIWWKRRGIFVALALGIYLIISHLIFMRDVPLADDIIRAGMFLVIGTVVAILAEGLTGADTLYARLRKG
jgi:hypothetical protein